ncbi:hypothetical protein [Brachybacterium timonense]|uniref:hypothetical protein n=1 Tax=Brachybacterium timonense TaxID=2050896 RepID=UPI000D0B11DF|nr:hypothetical protein [Brachybacterium timonense]
MIKDVEAIDGVTSCDVSLGGGGGLRRTLGGSISCDVGRDELEKTFDEAFRIVITYVHDLDEGDGAREVTGMSAKGEDGSTFTPREWIGADQNTPISVGMFYDRYGLN